MYNIPPPPPPTRTLYLYTCQNISNKMTPNPNLKLPKITPKGAPTERNNIHHSLKYSYFVGAFVYHLSAVVGPHESGL
jgi:hypothetical protein